MKREKKIEITNKPFSKIRPYNLMYLPIYNLILFFLTLDKHGWLVVTAGFLFCSESMSKKINK